MKEIITDIIIDAPADRVWATLMDHNTYPEWNPFIQELKGEARVGRKLDVVIQPPGQKGMRFQPRVIAVEPQREFRWLGHFLFPRIFDGEHYFQLQSQGENRTRLIHGERFGGILSGLLLKLIGDHTRAGFVAMNEALKQRVEVV